MKATFYIVTLMMALMLAGSCQDEVVVTDDDLVHTWEAKMFLSVESVTYPKNENTPILLTFKADGTYYLKLDINSCGGGFDAGKGHSLTMEFPACTEACCDSQFSNKLASMLPKVTTYRIEGPYLYLGVPEWGEIKLELVE